MSEYEGKADDRHAAFHGARWFTFTFGGDYCDRVARPGLDRSQRLDEPLQSTRRRRIVVGQMNDPQ